MRSVLVSIRPKWCEKIIKGQKTIEVRKSAPKEAPFKCYIYATKHSELWVAYNNGQALYDGKGKVIGEFICNIVEKLEEHIEEGGLYYTLRMDFNEAAQLDNWELHDYGNGKPIYAWHISDLKIYDKPKDLSEFYVRVRCRAFDKKCRYCDNLNCFKREDSYGRYYAVKKIIRPPQSWQYVEELKNV